MVGIATAVSTLAVVGVAASASAAGPSCEGSSPCVIVQIVGDGGTLLGSHEFDDNPPQEPWQGDITQAQYKIRTPRGEVHDQDLTNNVASIQYLIDQTPMNDGSGNASWQMIRYADVVDPNGTSHPLRGSELGNAGTNGFQGGLMPGIYDVTGGSSDLTLGYTRPLRSDTDVNYGDTFITSQALVIVAHTTGDLPTVGASVTPTTVMQGDPVHFSATASQGTPPYTYQWNFAGGTASQTDSTVTFSQPGTYILTVVATDSTGTVGPSAGAQVTVTCNPKTDPQQCGKPPRHKGHHPGGGGHHAGPHPPTGPVTGGGHHQGGGPGHHPRPQGQSGGTHVTGSPQGPAGISATTTSVPSTDRGQRHGRHAPTASGGTPLSGRLLLASQSEAVPTLKVAPQEATSAHIDPVTHWSWPWKWTGILIVPTLIGLGMAGEALHLRRRVARMSA
jgi:hypothetical protein